MAPRSARIYLDRVKERHTSHWDEDVLTREQLYRLHADATRRVKRYKRRQLSWIGFWLALLCLYPTLIYWGGRLLGM